jgi:hypothetical protein
MLKHFQSKKALLSDFDTVQQSHGNEQVENAQG